MIHGRHGRHRFFLLFIAACLAGGSAIVDASDDESKSRLPDEPIPLQPVPARPKPLLELGEPFLGTGTLGRGITLPTGATWQPSLLVWGQLRSALFAVEDRNGDDPAEWGNRLDVFTQLSLTYTERVVVSLRPLDESDETTGYVFSPDEGGGGQAAFDSTLNTFYFEGDFGELFPKLDESDSRALDFGFSVGRQPLLIQDGMLIGDSMDSVGVVRNALFLPGFNTFRVTGLFGWGNVNRGGNNVMDPGARVVGIFTEGDTTRMTIESDLVYVSGSGPNSPNSPNSLNTGNGLFGAVSATGRPGASLNATFRGLFSSALEEATAFVGSGVLLTSELSMTPRGTHDLAYLNAYGAFGNYTPVARSARMGGPLGRMGILFEGSGIGAYGSALSNRSDDVWGLVAGYQKFVSGTRGQILFEVASRTETGLENDLQQGAFGTRFQHALGRRFLVRLEAFAVGREGFKPRYGARTELLLAF